MFHHKLCAIFHDQFHAISELQLHARSEDQLRAISDGQLVAIAGCHLYVRYHVPSWAIPDRRKAAIADSRLHAWSHLLLYTILHVQQRASQLAGSRFRVLVHVYSSCIMWLRILCNYSLDILHIWSHSQQMELYLDTGHATELLLYCR